MDDGGEITCLCKKEVPRGGTGSPTNRVRLPLIPGEVSKRGFDPGDPGQSRSLPLFEPEENNMPYDSVDELPDSVKNALPKKAQEIFKSAFNNAWDEYKDPEDRKGDASREEVANKVAWSAVKKKYEKKGDNWQRK